MKKEKGKSEAVAQDEKEKDPQTKTLILTTEQKDRYNLNVQRIEQARIQRATPREEFDDMTYEMDYFFNKRAANAYLPKKLNDNETRVVTPTIETRLQVLINELLSMNLQPEGKAYDTDDNEMAELGQDFMDIVKRTNEIERDDDFWIDFLKEMLSQRTVFIQEKFVEQKYKTAKIYRAEKKLLSGLRVYLGDISIPARLFQTQPYVVLYTRRNYTEARTIYDNQNWERFQYVKPGQANLKDNPYGYRMNTLNDHEVEELHIIDPVNNEYDIIMNGIPMMEEPKPCPWTITADRCYNMTQITVKPLDTDFAYGKSPVNSAKFLQGFKDEAIRLLIEKFRQAVKPPIGMKQGRLLSKDIWTAGTVTQGVTKEMLSTLIDHQGVTQSEFNMIDLIEKKTEEFIGAGALQQGMAQKGEQTAHEIQQLQTNSTKNLGLIVAAFTRAKRDCAYMRIYNIAENFVAPKKRKYDPFHNQVQKVFSRFTINDTMFPDGRKGKKVVQFTDSPLSREEKENIYAYEQREASLGRNIRIRAINTDLLQSIPLIWCVTVNPQPRDGSQLQKVLFKDMLTQGIGIEQASQGQKQVNWEKAAEKFERTWETKDFFKKQAPTQEGQGGQPAGEPSKQEELLKEIDDFERTQAGSEMTESVRRNAQAPSINRIEDDIS
jgi:hypothetical protein